MFERELEHIKPEPDLEKLGEQLNLASGNFKLKEDPAKWYANIDEKKREEVELYWPRMPGIGSRGAEHLTRVVYKDEKGVKRCLTLPTRYCKNLPDPYVWGKEY